MIRKGQFEYVLARIMSVAVLCMGGCAQTGDTGPTGSDDAGSEPSPPSSMDPVDSMDPSEPTDPMNPASPNDPMSPSDPMDPMNPTDPMDTMDQPDAMVPMDPMDPPDDEGRVLPPVDSVDTDGPFETTIDEGSDHWVFRPTDLGKDGLEHPVFVWGTGSTAVPSQYTDHFTRMASHGFVIVAPTPSQLNASLMTAALDWILAENERMDSPYYQKLDPERVAMGGHSQGSTSTFNAEENEDRLVTTIHIAGGSFDGAGSSKVNTPTAYICGEDDIARENCERDFENVEDQPTFFSILQGVGHIDAAREALPGMIAWLRWHLAGETERKAQFTGPDGMFFQGMWQSETKNWN